MGSVEENENRDEVPREFLRDTPWVCSGVSVGHAGGQPMRIDAELQKGS